MKYETLPGRLVSVGDENTGGWKGELTFHLSQCQSEGAAVCSALGNSELRIEIDDRP